MTTTIATLAKVEKTTKLDQLTQIADFTLLKRATMFYLKSQIAHSKYNTKKTLIYKKALLAGITE